MGKKLPEQTKKEVKKARKAMKEGKADNIDRLLVIMSDGKWHDGAEFANKVTWRFSGTLHDLKKRHGRVGEGAHRGQHERVALPPAQGRGLGSAREALGGR